MSSTTCRLTSCAGQTRTTPSSSGKSRRAPRPPRQGRRAPRPATTGMVVTRVVDSNGDVSFAGTMYRAGRPWRGQQVEVSIVAESVQIAYAGSIVKTHAIRHDRAKEHGAYATPHGRPRKPRQQAKDDPAAVKHLPESIGQAGTGT